MSAIASMLDYAVKFVNLFARRQHLIGIAAKPTDVDSNILFYSATSFLFQFCLNYSRITRWWYNV